MHSNLRSLACAALAAATCPSAQETPYVPVSTGSWRSQDLALGRSFTRRTDDSIWIWLGQYSQALWTNELEVFGSDGMPVALFNNFASPESLINLSEKADIRIGDTLWFRCTVTEGGGGVNRLPKYSGPNRPGGKYFSGAAQPSTVPREYAGRRWSVAGRIDRDFVEFGFEDVADTNSNFSFDDLVARMYLPEPRPAEGIGAPALYPRPAQGEYVDRVFLFAPSGTTLRYSLDGSDPAVGTAYVHGTPVAAGLDPFRLRSVAMGPGGSMGPETVYDYNGYGLVAIPGKRAPQRARIMEIVRSRGYDAAGRRKAGKAGGPSPVFNR